MAGELIEDIRESNGLFAALNTLSVLGNVDGLFINAPAPLGSINEFDGRLFPIKLKKKK